MKSRIFRGAIRPALWLGMPFLFGLMWMLVSFLALLYAFVLFRDSMEGLMISILSVLFVSAILFVLVRDITKKDPFRLRQVRLRLMLRLEQGNFSKRGEFVYVPFTPKKKK